MPDLPDALHLFYAESEQEPDEFTLRGIPPLCWRADTPVLFEPFQLRENTDYFIDITLPVGPTEAESRAAAHGAWPFAERLAPVFKRDPPRRWRQTQDGRVVISGQIRLKNHAGIIDFSTDYGTPLMAEIVCRKIDYLEEFRTLLNDVADELTELLLQYESPVSLAFNLTDVSPRNEAALLFVLRGIMAEHNLPVAVDELLTHIHVVLVEQRSSLNIEHIEDPDVENFISDPDFSSLAEGGPLAPLFRGYTPREFPVTDLWESADTAENRYVKYFLEECLLLMQRLTGALRASRKSSATREVESWIRQLDEALSLGIWRDIGPFTQFPSNSQVLQRRRGYRDILKFDLSLRMSLTLPWTRAEEFADGLTGDVRPVSELYEYWCFFMLRRTIAELCEAELTEAGSLISVSEDKLFVRLRKGRRSRVAYLYRGSQDREIRVNLFYNRSFRRPNRSLPVWAGSYTATFDPDYSIEIVLTSNSTTHRHWLHFDAKYRLEIADIAELFSEIADESISEEDGSDYDRELTRLHKQDDLFKMHTYRDGILSSRGAYVLFPGDGADIRLSGKRQNLFVRHPSAFGGEPGLAFPSVGAFDLCPGRDHEQRPVLKSFLARVLETIDHDQPYAEESGFFLEDDNA